MARNSVRDWDSILYRAAAAGKKAILRNYDQKSRTMVMKRGMGGDLTLKIDEVSERAIYSSLNRDLGKDGFIFLSEEIGEIGPTKNRDAPVVICDPLDGSHNAQVGIPFFSVALSVIDSPSKRGRTFGDVNAAIISSVKTQDDYLAIKGRGAYHNKERLKPRKSQPKQIQTLLLETGDVDYLKQKLLFNFSKRYVNKTRMLGSAALSLCLLADGAADGVIFAQPGGARTIDSPAGYLIARENGCVFSDASGKISNIDDVEVGFDSRINLIGAANSKICRLLEKLVHLP